MRDGKLKNSMIIGILILLIIAIISAVDFSPVDLIPNNATTQDTLICMWTESTDVNVTWYNNSVRYGSLIINATMPQIIAAGVAKRDQNWNCTVVEWNDASNILSDVVTIGNANPAQPTLTNSNLNLFEDQTWTSDILSTDPDGDLVRFFCLPSDIVDTCNSAGNLVWLPLTGDVEPNASKTYNMTIYAYDPYDGISTKKITFNLTAVNDAPTFSPALSNRVINENSTLQASITVTDEENVTGPFLFWANSSSYPPLEKITFNSSNNKTFLVFFSPNNRRTNFSDVGNLTVWVRACDPRNSTLCVNGTFNVEVVPINHAPVFTQMSSTSGVQNSDFTLYINASDTDTYDTLQFSVTSPGCPYSNLWTITTTNSSANGSAVISVIPLNNTHIVCRNITISVTDTKVITSQAISLNLTNVNDYPVIYNMSYYSGNTHTNVNISNLYAYRNAFFVYKVNGSDIDQLVNSSETMTYSDNSSLCAGACPTVGINPTTGIIQMQINESFIGNYSYRITLTDFYGLTTTALLYLHAINNTLPYFNHTFGNMTAYEDIRFTYKFNATDLEGGFDSFSLNTNMFNISSTGLINFTPVCSQTGNWSVAVTINDTIGAYNETTFNLEIRPTGDAPILPVVLNQTMLEEIPFLLDIGSQVTDADITCGQADSLTFTSRFLNGPTLFNISSAGVVSFTPNSTSDGDYSINISVTDSFGLSSSLRWNITITNRTNPPVIYNVTPYGFPYNPGWISLSDLGVDYTTINVSENTTVFFNHNSSDPDGNPLVFNWTVDQVNMGVTPYLNYTWNFSDSGSHNVTLNVYDLVNGTAAHKVSFSWMTQVVNINRPPQLITNLPDVNVTGVTAIANYLTCINYVNLNCVELGFYDPDGDSMSYTYSTVSFVDIDVSGDTVTFTGIQVGTEIMYFTASDGQLSANSNNITVNVLEIAEESTSEEEQTSGGSSSGGPAPYYVYEEVEKIKDMYLDILVPQPITLYRNNTIRETIKLVNKGNETLRGITIGAETNASDADVSFSKYYFIELPPGKTETTELIITAYKLLNHYEIVLRANVSNPKYSDKAVIFINALEKSRGNQSLTATKITFTQDLLSSNPECIELNEFIMKAQTYIDSEDYDQASVILDSVIQGCKYLVSQSKLHAEKPESLRLPIDLDSNPFIKPALIVFLIFMVVSAVLTYRLKKMNDKETM